MKSFRKLKMAAVAMSAFGTLLVNAAPAPTSFITETEKEFIGSGDFDADSQADLIIIDKDTGRIRIGYQGANNLFAWPRYVNTGVKDVSGITVGKLFAAKKDSAAVVSANGNGICAVEIPAPGQAGKAVPMTPPGLGPNSVISIGIGGAGNSPLQDLIINTTFNDSPANKATLFRNNAGAFAKIADSALTGAALKLNRLSLADKTDVICYILNEDKSDSFVVQSLASGKPVTIGSVKDIPAESGYLVGSFRGASLKDVVFFKAGEKTITCRSMDVTGTSAKFGDAKSFELEGELRSLFVVPADGGDKLVAIYGTNGASATLFNFDGAKAPASVKAFKAAEGEAFCGVASYPNGFMLLSSPNKGKIKYSGRFQQYILKDGAWAEGSRGSLPNLDDTDDATVPDIHKMIIAKQTEKAQADMKVYTNTIPGTAVQFTMVPIPGGEFVMGSPEAEKDRKADEGPQHKVKIEPFWMGQYEITWGEYEIFMYRDEERKFKDTIPTDPAVDKVSDGVTRPSKPYVEMSFGMGKDGFPAIAMTHHAANKFCHWLSAKTGQFYRLPTEAEWEYACRAGTTTAYYYGDDASKLGDYAWFEQNSDFKYQKVGKKKPNAWGLYDMTGNVTEWCLDQFDPAFYGTAGNTVVIEPWNKATKPYPHAVRGGSWDEPAAACRSAARRGSDRSWKQTEPQLPKSIWWLSDAQWVGFRIIRPLKVPSPDEMIKYWSSGTERD